MITKKISLFYEVTGKEIVPPDQGNIDKKDKWLKEVQNSVEAEWKPKVIKVTYELFNPETESQRKFFEGAVVDYWLIQSQEDINIEITPGLHKKARNTLLDNILGFNVSLMNRIVRRRRTTTDFIDTQKWHEFLETVRETEFEPNGYEFPNSKYFNELSDKYGYDKAKGVALDELRKKLYKKLS